jgi:UDPglucose--hexose-1-phosphate uridylyltransferase
MTPDLLPKPFLEIPHRRYNPLTREWVLVSPHRAKRPWLGQVEKVPPENLPRYDPQCYLCPGNERAAGRHNPAYTQTFVFDNDFPALLRPEQITQEAGDINLTSSSPLFISQAESGVCRVVCFSPRHDLTLPEMNCDDIEAVIHTWSEQTTELAALEYISYVQVFENKGALMGCSNPHPHSQIWATSRVPNEPSKEIAAQMEYQDEHGDCLLCNYLAQEQQSGARLVASNQHFTALVPFWAFWPFELILISHRHVASLPELSQQEVTSLSEILKRITTRFDNLFEISFPYSMGFHQAPCDGGSYPFHHLHAHYYPPLLRSATVRKFMVGYEMLGMPQRDLTAETAAERLRSLSDLHYRVK